MGRYVNGLDRISGCCVEMHCTLHHKRWDYDVMQCLVCGELFVRDASDCRVINKFITITSLAGIVPRSLVLPHNRNDGD